jgi:polysaccharide biosynthesis transport protein
MLRGRTRLPLLAEVSGPPKGARAWSLRRADFEALEEALSQLAGQRVVVITGQRDAAPVAAIALAAAATAKGWRTILVECDLAQPRLAAYVGLAPEPGLHEYLRWEAEPADVLQPVALGGPAADGSADPLACVCGGRPASKTEALLGLQSFAHMVEKLRAGYELVVLSAPPLLDEPASLSLAARQADAVVAGMPKSAIGDRPVAKAIKRLPVSVLGAIAVEGT